MNEKEMKFLDTALLVNPETGERMEITKTEGKEKGKDCLEITVEGITGSFLHRIYTSEILVKYKRLTIINQGRQGRIKQTNP
jgi:hypothetical protein